MQKRLFLCFFLLILGMLPAMAQTPTTQGTEFWASFMRNGYNTNIGSAPYNHFTLIASAKRACTVTVTNPNTGWMDQFAVQANGVTTYYVNQNQGYNDQKGGKAFKGLYITSSDTISLYIANEAKDSYDAANVLPASTLGSQYMIQSFKSMGTHNDSRASFLVLATEDNTEVQITPSCQTYDYHPAGQPYIITLNRGECYHVLNLNQGSNMSSDGDFSGTTVISPDDKPIAVFNGNSITSVPGGLDNGYDHVFEQAMPIDYWGKKFVVTSIYPDNVALESDMVKITALNDGTVVYRDGSELFELNAGQSESFWMDLTTDPCAYLESNNPVAVYLYNHSHRSGEGQPGDPSMVWISPVEQTVEEVTFSTFQVQDISSHYVNIVCYSEFVSGMTIDGQSISGFFQEVPGMPELSYSRKSVEHGVHTLRCPGGFVAHVYGIGQAEGYAYSVGSSAKILTKQLYVNDILSSELPDGYTTCQNEEVTFRVETNYEIDHVEWDFGDNTNATGSEVKHVYPFDGSFDVQSVVFRSIEKEVQPFDTLSVVIHVSELNQMCVHETTCDDTYFFRGEYYQVPCDTSVIVPGDVGCDTLFHLQIDHGNEVTHTLSPISVCEYYVWFGDTIVNEGLNHLEHFVPNATPEGCDSLYFRDVTIGNPPANPERWKSSCNDYYWFGVHCDATNDYTCHFTTAEGCEYDSILHFTLVPLMATEETLVACEPTWWHNIYVTQTDDYEYVSEGLNNCDTIHVLHFTLDQKVQLTFDTVVCDEYVWREHVYHQTGIYQETVPGVNGCDSILILDLTLYNTPPFEEIVGLGNVAVATTFWPGKYMYYLDDYEGLASEDIHWKLLGETGWTLDTLTYGRDTCVITASTMGMDTLCVWTSVEGGCDKMRQKVINASGFDVGEHGLGEIKVYPNPTRDELFVEAEELERVVVYDMLGQRLKEVGKGVDGRMQVKVGDLPSALYLVEIRTKRGNKTQLFSVIR